MTQGLFNYINKYSLWAFKIFINMSHYEHIKMNVHDHQAMHILSLLKACHFKICIEIEETMKASRNYNMIQHFTIH